MLSFLRREYEVFRSCPPSMRLLLAANMIYGMALPVIDIFISAYVMRNTRDPVRVISYPLGLFLGTPVAFALNGLLLRRVQMKYLYAGGMVLYGIALMLLTRISELTLQRIVLISFLMGIANGFFWANRQFLVLNTTTDDKRNYYYGVELFFGTIAAVIVPVSVGWFISGTFLYGWLGGVPNRAYFIVALVVMLLSTLSGLLVIRGEFSSRPIGRYFYWSFHPVWWRMLMLACFKGMVQGYILVMPAMMVMLLVGHEGTLGVIESLSGVLTAFMLYLIGRLTAPRHRAAVFAAGLSLYLLGALINSVFFNVAGVIGFQLCLVLSKPMLDLAYWPIQLEAVDRESRRTGRERYAFLMNHEFGVLFGRLFGCSLLIALALGFSSTVALRYAMPVVALVQMLSIPVYLWLRKDMYVEAT